MVYLLDYFQHRRDCKFKQAERADRIARLRDFHYHGPLTAGQSQILDKPIEELVRDVKSLVLDPIDILRAYGKAALKVHAVTDCCTEIMIAAAESWITDGSINMRGPLAGVPVSLKDSVVVGGFDSTIGYSRFVGNKTPKDGAMVRLLKDAGAVPYVKTNIPITLLSFESTNDVWGRCTNPHNGKYSPGGSTGGEGALLAAGGGRIGIGSDVAGSVRVPAHFSGIYALRCSTGRWPRMGNVTSMPGQEGVPSVFSPMARTLGDLRYFTAGVIGMRPWTYDHTVHPIPWRGKIVDEVENMARFKVGVMRTDGVVDPSPACARALEEVVEALQKHGHQVTDVTPPDPYEGLCIASQLLNSDGCRTFKALFRTGEWEDAGAKQLSWLMGLPRPFKWLYYMWVKYVRRDDIWAGLIRDWHEKSAFEQWKLVSKREEYRARWHDWWEKEAKIDFLITPPNATPAVPHDGMANAVSSCGYTFLFNLLDYTCGVLPITHVDRERDALPAGFRLGRLNGVARGAYMHYDAAAMHGLPVAVQVVGRRLEEEKVLALMGRVERMLGGATATDPYRLLEID